MKKIILGITGASGSIYPLRLLEVLAQMPVEAHIVASEMGAQVFKHETGHDLQSLVDGAAQFKAERSDDFFSCLASGSYRTDGMVILPCSMSTVGHLAGGISSNLLHRAAAVCLKERRKLVIAFREMPVTSVDLQNMLTLSNSGAVILPLAPGFYHKPTTCGELIDFVVGKVLDSLEIENNLYKRWPH